MVGISNIQNDDFKSPAWHGEILKEREECLARGEESFMNWEDAKAELRRLHSRDLK